VRSHWMKVKGGQLGTADWISLIASTALDSLRADRYMCAGECCASWRIVSFPSPTLPLEELAEP
jgi:hypothetical protein